MLVACGDGAETGIPLAYDNEIPEGGIQDDDNYNHDLFYRNDTLLDYPDNCTIYITDQNSTEYGYYYIYGTVTGLGAYRSKDLIHWENAITVAGHNAFTVKENSIVNYNIWAPEVIYDAEEDMYYLFASGSTEPDSEKHIFMAKAKEPYGPFEMVDETKWLIDADQANAAVAEGDRSTWQAIDASPFVGADGEKYLMIMLAGDPGDGGYDTIWGMRMIDWNTPDYSTLTRLTKNGYLTTEGEERASYEEVKTRNEAPFMYVRTDEEGKTTYYLTMSINGLNDYTVIQAVGENPLGPFRKLTAEEGGILLSTDNLTWDHIKGPGHHSFVQAGDELYIMYHQQANRAFGDSWIRTIAKDRINFVKNDKGQEVMVANGPTWSLQPQVEEIAEYKNIAPEAKVTATKGENVEALTDGVLSLYKGVNFVKEFESSKTTTITIDFGEYREITGLMVYNSKWYEKAFVSVDRVEFDFRNEELPDGAMAYINNLEFDWESYKNATVDDMRPGGSAVAVFEPLEVKTIRITFKLPIERPDDLQLLDDEGYIMDQEIIGVPEIVVLGK